MLAYAKADKGFAEIESRAFGLSPKLRRVLILIDGKRNLDALRTMLGLDGIEKLLDDLTSQGFIKKVDAHGDAAEVDAPADEGTAAAPVEDVLAALPESRSASEIEKAKNFMINTLVHFHGQYTKLDVMRAVKACETAVQVRAQYPDWVRCMHESRQAEKRLPDLTRQLLAVL